MTAPSDQVAQSSEQLFDQGRFCAESVLQAVAESRGIQSDLIPKMATGLGRGLSRTGGTGGAVSGGGLAINLTCGRNDARQSVENNYRRVRTFLSAFEAKFGSPHCEKLIGCRLDTPEGQQCFKANPLGGKYRMFTREAARMADETLARE
jgi:C_GCAxxG_C_C family probable redox protein